MTTILRCDVCRQCGEPLQHKRTGRPKRFCSARCRMAYRRALKRWAHRANDAALAGEQEPAPPGVEVHIACYTLDQAGNVTKRA